MKRQGSPICWSLWVVSFLWTNLISGSLSAVPAEQDVLLEIKKSFGNPEILESWTADLECYKWQGVSCDDKGFVTSLSLRYVGDMGLTGSIPSSLGNLKNLQVLDISSQLSGPIPSSLGNLKNLTHLYISSNQLSGPIPSSLGNLKNLQVLYLYSNQLSGRIPSSLGNLKNLNSLSLESNILSGPIPSSLGNLKNLQDLTLNYNYLSGPIPSSLGNLKNLEHWSLESNQLSGRIPSSLGKLKNLVVLSLHDNQLSGPIPSSLGNLKNLESCSLDSNYLVGSSPVHSSKIPFCDVSSNCLKNVSGQRSFLECFSFCSSNSTSGPCSGHGTCSFNAQKKATCTCESGWASPNCQHKMKLPPPRSFPPPLP